MLKMFYLQSATLLLSILLGLMVTISGCSLTNEAEKNALQEKNMLLSAELATQSSLTAKLQMQLLEKNAEINKLASTQQDVVRKMKEARSKRRMRGPTNKAEVVAFLAEVTTDIDSAREATSNKGQQHALTKAEQILSQGKAELEQGDFDKAYSLADQALELIQTMQLKIVPSRKPPQGPFTALLAPLSVQLSKQSNMRKRPDVHAQILHVLAPGTTVTATGYQGQWVKVTIKDHHSGWIHYSLLVIPVT
jgi:hypothetical protein